MIFRCMNIPHLFIYGHLDYFYFGAITNNAAMNIHLHVFVKTLIFISLGYIPRSGITESHGNSMFNHLRSGNVLLYHLRLLPY